MANDDKRRWRERKTLAEATRAVLVERFPRCFCPKGNPKRPLKIGIYHDIKKAAPDLRSHDIHVALSDYTSGRTYRRQLISGAARVDLDGWPAGEVTAEQAAEAAAKLRRQERNAAEKKAAPSMEAANA